MKGVTVFVLSLALSLFSAVGLFAGSEPIEKFKKIMPQMGESMLSNGDFEKDTDGDGMPDEWGNVEHRCKTSRWKISREKMLNGNHVLKVQFLTKGDCVINYLLRERHRYFEPGEAATVYHALRVKHAGHGIVFGRTISSTYASIGLTRKIGMRCDWRTLAGVYRYDPAVHRGIAMVRIYIKEARPGDRYWIDDYVLRLVTATEGEAILNRIATKGAWKEISPEEAAAAKDVNKGNMLRDSSFELNPAYCPIRYGLKWWSIGGKVVKGDSAHGEYAVRNEVYSDPYLFRAGKPHTLSLFAKGTGAKSVTVTVGDSFSSGKQGARKGFELTSQWKRCSFSFVPRQNDEATQAALKIIVDGREGCLIDAVQLEEGGLTDYSGVDGELSLLIARRADRSHVSFFYDGEKIPMLVAVQKKGPAEIDARVVVRDFWMNVVRRVPVKFSIPAGQEVASIELALEPFERGAYLARLEGNEEKSRSMQFGVISRDLAEGSEIMGASHTTGLDFNRHFVEALGITWTRHHAAYSGPHYSRTAKTPWLGKDYWVDEDKQLAQKTKNPKLRYWGSSVYPPEPWRSELKRVAGSKKPLPKGYFQTMDEYFEAAVPRFKKTIKYWECWNEPPSFFSPEQYLQMLVWFNRTIKRLDPEAVVVGFSGYLDPEWWNHFMVPLMKMGALKHCDVVSYHGYNFADPRYGSRSWPEEKLFGYKTLAEYLDFIRAEARKVGKSDMPIRDNEFTLWGTSWYDNERVPDVRGKLRKPFDYATGAAIIVHYVTIGYAHGVRHFGPHCFDHQIKQQRQGTLEYNQHGMDYDYGIKPKAISYAVVCNKMNGAKYVSEKIKSDLHAYVFDKSSGSLAVVFARTGKKAVVSMKAADGLDYRNIFDGPFAGVSKDGDKIRLKLLGQPVYIQSKVDGKALATLLEDIAIVD